MADWHSERLRLLREKIEKARSAKPANTTSLGESIGEAMAVVVRHQLKGLSSQRTELGPLLPREKQK